MTVLRPEIKHEVEPGLWIVWDAVLSDDDPIKLAFEEKARAVVEKLEAELLS